MINPFKRLKFWQGFADNRSVPTPINPIGIVPKSINDALRMENLIHAIYRYTRDGWEIDLDWLIELGDLARDRKWRMLTEEALKEEAKQ